MMEKSFLGGEIPGQKGAVMIRLNSEGTYDDSFKLCTTNYKINTVTIQSDEKIIVGGSFTYVNNNYSRNKLIRIEGLCQKTSIASSEPIITIGTTLPVITHNTSGAYRIGEATGLPSNVIATWNANIISITGTPTEIGEFNYSIPLIGECNNVFAKGKITVVSATQLTNNKMDMLNIWPNPTTDILFISEELIGKSYSIFNLTGELVKKASSADATIDFSELKPSVYIMHIGDNTYKVVKK